MEKHTVVSIYEVDECGTTGPWAGQGSLVAPRLVLAHPPLSELIAAGERDTKFRVGIFEPRDEIHPIFGRGFTEIIDVWGSPRIFRAKNLERSEALVALELRTPAISEANKLQGNEIEIDDFIINTSAALRQYSTEDWQLPLPRDPSPMCKMLRLFSRIC